MLKSFRFSFVSSLFSKDSCCFQRKENSSPGRNIKNVSCFVSSPFFESHDAGFRCFLFHPLKKYSREKQRVQLGNWCNKNQNWQIWVEKESFVLRRPRKTFTKRQNIPKDGEEWLLFFWVWKVEEDSVDILLHEKYQYRQWSQSWWISRSNGKKRNPIKVMSSFNNILSKALYLWKKRYSKSCSCQIFVSLSLSVVKLHFSCDYKSDDLPEI